MGREQEPALAALAKTAYELVQVEIERDRLREALENVDVALGYLDATSLDQPGVRQAHLDAARDAIRSALSPESNPGTGER